MRLNPVLALMLLFVLALTGCTNDRPTSADLQNSDNAPDIGVGGGAQDIDLPDFVPSDVALTDTGVGDTDTSDTTLDDTGTDDADVSDTNVLDTSMVDVDIPDATPPGVGLLLRGVVLQPDGVLDPGEVLVLGSEITCVAEDCSDAPGADMAARIDTRGVISPGLIDAHNHLPYDFLDEWIPPDGTVFTNRYQWADDPTYEDWVAPYANNRSSSSHYCPAAKWGEWRALLHGTTTMQGQSFDRRCIRSWVRNADHSHDLQYDHMRTWIGSVRDITDDDADNFVEGFTNAVEPITRLAIHMTEGISDNNIELEFDSFAGRDTRNNRHQGISLLGDTSILIHAVGLTDDQLVETAAAGAYVVWSPSSNMALYGDTTDIDRVLELEIVTGLGPDWTPSGEDHMLAEMRYAYNWAMDNDAARVTPEALWRMATLDGAQVVGLGEFIGRIEEGYRADIVVFNTDPNDDPYEVVMNSDAQDIQLVLVDGRGFYGDINLQDATALNDDCIPFDACGRPKYFCAQDPTETDRGVETLDDVREQLFNILEGIGYPEDEQYMRGGEVLELLDCAP